MKRLEHLLESFVTRMVGFIAPIGLLDVLGDDPLTDLEESLEVFEPDELWAARRRHPAWPPPHHLPAGSATVGPPIRKAPGVRPGPEQGS